MWLWYLYLEVGTNFMKIGFEIAREETCGKNWLIRCLEIFSAIHWYQFYEDRFAKVTKKPKKKTWKILYFSIFLNKDGTCFAITNDRVWKDLKFFKHWKQEFLKKVANGQVTPKIDLNARVILTKQDLPQFKLDLLDLYSFLERRTTFPNIYTCHYMVQ